jgi:hypothetical protein
MHGGAIPGVSTVVALFPDDDLGLILLCNNDGKHMINEMVWRRLADSAFGLEPLRSTKYAVPVHPK